MWKNSDKILFIRLLLFFFNFNPECIEYTQFPESKSLLMKASTKRNKYKHY